jgi:hypothetical protein
MLTVVSRLIAEPRVKDSNMNIVHASAHITLQKQLNYIRNLTYCDILTDTMLCCAGTCKGSEAPSSPMNDELETFIKANDCSC